MNQLPAYTPVPIPVCNSHCSSRYCRILNPWSEDRDRLCNLILPSGIRFRCSTTGNSRTRVLTPRGPHCWMPRLEAPFGVKRENLAPRALPPSLFPAPPGVGLKMRELPGFCLCLAAGRLKRRWLPRTAIVCSDMIFEGVGRPHPGAQSQGNINPFSYPGPHS